MAAGGPTSQTRGVLRRSSAVCGDASSSDRNMVPVWPVVPAGGGPSASGSSRAWAAPGPAPEMNRRGLQPERNPHQVHLSGCARDGRAFRAENRTSAPPASRAPYFRSGAGITSQPGGHPVPGPDVYRLANSPGWGAGLTGVGRRTHRGGAPDSPGWGAGLTGVGCRTHRGGASTAGRRADLGPARRRRPRPKRLPRAAQTSTTSQPPWCSVTTCTGGRSRRPARQVGRGRTCGRGPRSGRAPPRTAPRPPRRRRATRSISASTRRSRRAGGRCSRRCTANTVSALRSASGTAAASPATACSRRPERRARPSRAARPCPRTGRPRSPGGRRRPGAATGTRSSTPARPPSPTARAAARSCTGAMPGVRAARLVRRRRAAAQGVAVERVQTGSTEPTTRRTCARTRWGGMRPGRDEVVGDPARRGRC